MAAASGVLQSPGWERKNKHCRKQADKSLHEKLLDCARTTIDLMKNLFEMVGITAACGFRRISVDSPQSLLATAARNACKRRRLRYFRK
jgi:hypothetical protein